MERFGMSKIIEMKRSIISSRIQQISARDSEGHEASISIFMDLAKKK